MSLLRRWWRGLRTLTGDDTYERYMQHQARAHPACPPLSRKAFFRQEQHRRWDKINRCC